jgi:hypothetical protein
VQVLWLFAFSLAKPASNSFADRKFPSTSVEEILLHSDDGFALGQPSDTLCLFSALAIVSLTAVAAVATTDESLSRVRMVYAQKMYFCVLRKLRVDEHVTANFISMSLFS